MSNHRHSLTALVDALTHGTGPDPHTKTPTTPVDASHYDWAHNTEKENTPMADYPFTPDETEAARHLLHHMGHPAGWEPGSFSTHLVRALAAADHWNRQRLTQAFPAYRRPLSIMKTHGADALADKLEQKEG